MILQQNHHIHQKEPTAEHCKQQKHILLQNFNPLLPVIQLNQRPDNRKNKHERLLDQKEKKQRPIPLPNAVPEPDAVVVEGGHTHPTGLTVLRPHWLVDVAGETHVSVQLDHLLFLLVVPFFVQFVDEVDFVLPVVEACKNC